MKPSITKNLFPVTNRKMHLKVIGTWICAGIKLQETLKPSKRITNLNSLKRRIESKSIKAQKTPSLTTMNYVTNQAKQPHPSKERMYLACN